MSYSILVLACVSAILVKVTRRTIHLVAPILDDLLRPSARVAGKAMAERLARWLGIDKTDGQDR